MKIVIGLGNPGEEYARTRHNTGFRVVDCLAEKLRAEPFAVGSKAVSSLIWYEKIQVMLVKPMTYMNLSGEVVSVLGDMLGSALDNMLVITDDLHLPLGRMRFRSGGSCGGHNGLASIEQALATTGYPRLRIGIGVSGDNATDDGRVLDDAHGKAENKLIDFVLGEFTAREEEMLACVVPLAAGAVMDWIVHGITYCQNEYNSRNSAIGTGGET